MDTGELYAKLTQMRESAVSIGRGARTIADCIESVDREIIALGSDRFMSAGAEAFRAEYQRLKPRLIDAFDQLAGFQNKLEAAADDIEAASRTGRS